MIITTKDQLRELRNSLTYERICKSIGTYSKLIRESNEADAIKYLSIITPGDNAIIHPAIWKLGMKYFHSSINEYNVIVPLHNANRSQLGVSHEPTDNFHNVLLAPVTVEMCEHLILMESIAFTKSKGIEDPLFLIEHDTWITGEYIHVEDGECIPRKFPFMHVYIIDRTDCDLPEFKGRSFVELRSLLTLLEEDREKLEKDIHDDVESATGVGLDDVQLVNDVIVTGESSYESLSSHNVTSRALSDTTGEGPSLTYTRTIHEVYDDRYDYLACTEYPAFEE
jgi:hypothetical protein